MSLAENYFNWASDPPETDEALRAQAVYWRQRAKFFEAVAYEGLVVIERLKEEVDADGENWKRGAE